MIQVHALPSFTDNYIWLIQFSNRQAVVIDPGNGELVLKELQARELNLSAILITHHHWDHVDGIETLLEQHSVPVYGPSKDPIPGRTHACHEDDIIQFGELQLNVLEVPGHTLGHLAYHGHQKLFCGDTLFAGGCGRLLGGSAEQLHKSLQRFASLPNDTQIYCSHEYTLANLDFALAVEPNNPALIQRKIDEQHKREQGLPTLPSNLALELATNPFLRCTETSVVQAVQEFSKQTINNEAKVFRTLRYWKDGFS